MFIILLSNVIPDTIPENRQLFAHVLRGRVKLTANQRPEHVKITMKNISKVRIHVVIPEGCVWQQIELNGMLLIVIIVAIVTIVIIVTIVTRNSMVWYYSYQLARLIL